MNNNWNYIEIDEKSICKLYNDKLSLRDIAKKYSVSVKKISNVLNKNNINRRRSKYSLNELYFNEIDTREKAYFLGLLFADGGIYKTVTTLTLQQEDKYIIDKFNKALSSNRELYFLKRPDRKDCYSLVISNKKLSQALIANGCMENKSFKIRLPEIKKDFLFDFIRGYFDGDGYFHLDKRKVNGGGTWALVSNKSFCRDIQLLLANLNIKSAVYQNSSRHKDMAEIRVGNYHDIKNIFKLMYKDTDLYLTRKYEKMLPYIARNQK